MDRAGADRLTGGRSAPSREVAEVKGCAALMHAKSVGVSPKVSKDWLSRPFENEGSATSHLAIHERCYKKRPPPSTCTTSPVM